MAVATRKGNHPHIEWVDIRQNGVMVECAIMKIDANGNRYYFEVGPLDGIDKRRLLKIITNRNANSFPLWDLMSQITLNNGVNALEYFHQLVRVLTPSGQIINPRSGETGYRQGERVIKPAQPQPVIQQPVQAVLKPQPVVEQVVRPTTAVKKAGRPPKSKK